MGGGLGRVPPLCLARVGAGGCAVVRSSKKAEKGQEGWGPWEELKIPGGAAVRKEPSSEACGEGTGPAE